MGGTGGVQAVADLLRGKWAAQKVTLSDAAT